MSIERTNKRSVIELISDAQQEVLIDFSISCVVRAMIDKSHADAFDAMAVEAKLAAVEVEPLIQLLYRHGHRSLETTRNFLYSAN